MRRITILMVIAITVAGCLGGGQTAPPTENPENRPEPGSTDTGGTEQPDTAPQPPLAAAWSHSIAGVMESMDMSNGRIYVGGGAPGTVTAFAPNGTVLWNRTLSERYPMRANAEDGVVIVSGLYEVIALDADTGTTRWHYTPTDLVRVKPGIGETNAYITSGAGARALSRTNGTSQWKTDQRTVLVRPAVGNQTVYIGSAIGGEGKTTVYAYDTSSGREQWHTTLSGRIGRITTAPGDRIYVGIFRQGGDSQLYALTASSGDVLWNRSLGRKLVSQPAIGDKHVYVSSGPERHRQVYALSAKDGSIAWTWNQSSPVMRPTLAGDTLFVPYRSGGIAALDPATGEQQWNHSTGRARTPLFVTQDQIYFGTGRYSGTVHAFERQ